MYNLDEILKEKKLSEMMKQYIECKKKYIDCTYLILLKSYDIVVLYKILIFWRSFL